MKNHAFLPRKIALAIGVASLVACSGDQGSSGASPDVDNGGPTQPTPVNQTAVRGQVIDGYLSNAFVCIDNNDNFVCDAAGEYRATTDAQGRFELTVPAGQAVDKLLAQIVPGQTIDMDNPDQAITRQSVLLPVNVKGGDDNSNLVTPFTTVIGALAKDSGEPVEVIAAQLAEKWALQDDFYAVDYVAANSNNKDAPVRAAAREIQQKWEEVIVKQASDNAGASWSQILTSSAAALASDDVQQDLDNDVQVVVRPAAAVLTIDDAADTLDWAFVAGFEQPQHYEFSVNSGASFQVVTVKPVALENLAYATGQVQLRVRADVTNNNPVGVAAKNASPLTRIVDDIAAPKNLLVNDVQDTLDWDNVSGYSNLSDYEYRITSGTQQRDWQAVNVKPLVIGDFDVAVNAIEIRVKAVASKNLAGQVARNPLAFNAVIRNIAAPANLVVDDVANTLDWQFVTGFSSAGDYEYHTGNGQWQTVNAKPLQVGDVAIAAGALQLRVKANAGQVAGASASSGAAFNTVIRNIAAPVSVSDDSADTFAWQLVSGYGQISDYEISINSAAWRTATATDRSIAIGNEKRDAGYVRVRVKAVAGVREVGATASSSAFTKAATAAPAPTNPVVDDVANTFDWTFANGFTKAADYQYRIGNGAWSTATAKPVQVGDVAIAAGGVELRVAAVAGEWLASPVITNADAFTIVVTDIAAPQVSGDDTANTFSWSFVAGYDNVSDYEIRINDGSWTVATDAQRTIAIGDVDRDGGYIEVRVKAVAGLRNAGAIAKSPAFKKTLVVATAPTNLVVNDAVNTLNWTFVSDYTKVSDYQYRINSGRWQPVTTKPIQVGDVAIAVGDMELRIAPIASERLAGQIAKNTEAFAEVIRGIAAPVPTSDDDADSFSWSLVNGYNDISDYEIKIDSADWRAAIAADRNIAMGDVARAAGYIQVRVAAVNGIREAGAIAQSAEFKKALVSAAAPTGLVSNDATDTLDWNYVAGFTDTSDYEYRITSGSQQSDWQTTGAKPLVVGDFDIDANAIEIRVTAVADVRLAGQVARSPQGFNAVIRNIAAPTNLQVNDVANTLDWNNVAGYTNIADYEFHTGDGNWQVTSAKPIEVGDVAIAAGALQLRVKAATGREAGATASNPTAFAKVIKNIAAPVATSDDDADTFSWSFVSGYENISTYEIKIGSADWRVATDSDTSVNVGDENRTAGYVQVRVAAVTGINDAGASAVSAEFTQLVIVAAPTNLVVEDDDDTLNWKNIAGFDNAADYQYALVIAGETQAWQNATAKPIQLSDDFVGTVKLRVTGEQNEVAESIAFTKTEFVKLDADGERLLSTATDFSCIKDSRFSGGIYWQKSSNQYSDTVPYTNSDSSIKTIESEITRSNSSAICGFSDWQAASIAELQKLRTYTYIEPGYSQENLHWGNGKYFSFMSSYGSDYYWSRDFAVENGVIDTTKRRVASRGYSQLSISDRELSRKYYQLLTRVPVIGATYIAKVAASKSELTSAQATLPGWQTDARNSVTTSQSEFTAAVNSADLTRLKGLLLARIEQANTRQDSVNTLTDNFDAKLTEFNADVTRLNNNPDGQVSDAELQQFNAALAEFEAALSAYKTAQNSDITDAVATLAAMQSKVAGVVGDTETAAQLATDTAAANAQLLTANTQAGEVTAAQQAVSDTPNDAALAETLYLAARTGLAEIFKAQQTLTDLQQRRQALVDLIIELADGAFGSNLIAAYQNQLGVLDQQITNLQNWINTRTPVTDLAVDDAFANGYTVSVAAATIVSGSVSFAKLDEKGRYIPADTTYIQGYRCVQDLREEQDKASDSAVIWRLLEKGSDDLKNRQDFTDAVDLLAEANTNNWCGKDNWSLPTVKQLSSLNTLDESSYYYDTTIDPTVFVNYAGSADKYGSSDAFQRYWQWTSVAGNAGERLAYTFNTNGYYKAETLSLDITDTLDSGYLVFARLVSFTAPPSKFEMLNVAGEVTTSADDWVCSRHVDNGLIWLRESQMPQPGVARTLAVATAEIDMVNICGSSDWRLPSVAELQALRPVDGRHFATINEDVNYMTSATEKDVYDRLMPVVFSFKTGNSETGRNSDGYMGLWVTNATGSARAGLASGFVGLDNLGQVTLTGVNYCIREESSGNVWTTHLSVSKDASNHSGVSSFTRYCGISGNDWKYPTVAQMQALYSEPALTNLHGDRVIDGSYWTSDIKDDPACTGWGCDQIATVITHEGNEQQVTIDPYSSSAPKNHNRYIYTTN